MPIEKTNTRQKDNKPNSEKLESPTHPYTSNGVFDLNETGEERKKFIKKWGKLKLREK